MCFYYILVVKESSFLCINICSENPAHRKSANCRHQLNFKIFKMKITDLTLVVGIVTILASCGSETTSNDQERLNVVEPELSATTENENQKLDTKSAQDRLETEAGRLRGGGQIKSIKLDSSKAIIDYVESYEEYKKLNPSSGLTELDLNSYWDTEEAIKKALNDGAVRLMRKLDFVEQVEITLPRNGKEYKIDVSKSNLESFIGQEFETIQNNWDSSFSDPYVYDETGRDKFFSKFGSIK